MAVSERKSLVWEIRKSLFTLSAEELFQIAKGLDPAAVQDQPELQEDDQEGCFDYITSFMYSKHLLELEDSGMVELLMLKDLIDTVIEKQGLPLPDVRGDTESQTLTQTVQTARIPGDIATSPPQTVPVTATDDTVRPSQTVGADNYTDSLGGASTTSQVRPMSAKTVSNITDTEIQEMLTSYEELGRKLRQRMMIPSEQSPQHSPGLPSQASKPHSDSSQHNLPGQPIAYPAHEGTVFLRDLSYLQRREFKVQGGQVGDHSSDISYNNI